MNKYLISIGCGLSQKKLLSESKRLGFNLYGVAKDSPVDLIDKYVSISTYDCNHVLNYFNDKRFIKNPPKGVICHSSGPSVKTSYELSKLFNLKSCGELVSNMSLLKSEINEFVKTNDFPIITEFKITNISELFNLIFESEQELIIKPNSPIYGKKNVYKISKKTNLNYLEKYFKNSLDESFDANVAVQKFISGDEVVVMVSCLNGEILDTIYLTEKVDFDKNVIVESNFEVINILDYHLDIILLQNIVNNLIHNSYSSGFVSMCFRIDEKGIPYLFEVNPGLVGDGIIDNILSKYYPLRNFYNEYINLMVDE